MKLKNVFELKQPAFNVTVEVIYYKTVTNQPRTYFMFCNNVRRK